MIFSSNFAPQLGHWLALPMRVFGCWPRPKSPLTLLLSAFCCEFPIYAIMIIEHHGARDLLVLSNRRSLLKLRNSLLIFSSSFCFSATRESIRVSLYFAKLNYSFLRYCLGGTKAAMCFFNAVSAERLSACGRFIALMLSSAFSINTGFMWSFWLSPKLAWFYPKNSVLKMLRT